MSLAGKLVGFGFRQVIGAVAGDGAGELTVNAAGTVVQLVEKHFTDHSQKLPKALARANERAWQAVSIALAGDGFLSQIKLFFASSDDKGIREQVQLFLRDKNIGFEGTSVDFRKKCLAELTKAKKAGLLSAQKLVASEVGQQAAQFQRYADPKGMVDGAEQVIGQIADDLASEYPNLAKLLRQRPAGGPPLLVSAFAYFFCSIVEANPELGQGLIFDGLRQLSASQAKAFGQVIKALVSLDDQFERVFEQLDRIDLVDVKTHGAVLDMQVELQRLSSLQAQRKKEEEARRKADLERNRREEEENERQRTQQEKTRQDAEPKRQRQEQQQEQKQQIQRPEAPPPTTPDLHLSDHNGDQVDCTVFAPPEVHVGHTLMVQVWMHTLEQARNVQERAEQHDDEAKLRGETSLETEIKRGSKLVFQLAMPGLKIDQRLRFLYWNGKPSSVQFLVTIPKNHIEKSIYGTVTISQEQLPVGEIKFKLRVIEENNRKEKPPVPTGEARSFESYFISYASADRLKVLEKVQILPRLGKRYFMDVLRLEPGDRWEPKLFINIDESDAVLLFWSSNAKMSEWVMRECRYAISKKGIERILPVIIEGPPPIEPPPELAELHLNDTLLYVIYTEKEISKNAILAKNEDSMDGCKKEEVEGLER